MRKILPKNPFAFQNLTAIILCVILAGVMSSYNNNRLLKIENLSTLPVGIYYLHIYDGISSTPEIQQIMVER